MPSLRGSFESQVTIFAYIAQWFREWRAKCKAVAEIRKLQRNLDALTVGKATASDVLDGWILEANPKCKKCRGRGYASYQRDKTTPIPCSCARAVRNTKETPDAK
jgi:hypothetical protein